ncbi:MAG: helix-turn-helix domain-containing protein, partial [Mycobacteriaceae bacterium]|nr:helix-turn-helix domain-containing protein [Mycobacteriaceae bacterium]
ALTGLAASIPFHLEDFRWSSFVSELGPGLVTGIGSGFIGAAAGGLRSGHAAVAENPSRVAVAPRQPGVPLAALHAMPGTAPPPAVADHVPAARRATPAAAVRGLDLPGISTETGRDLTKAVAHMTGRHPDVPLREVAVVDFGPDAVTIARTRHTAEGAVIELNHRYLANPDLFSHVQRSAYYGDFHPRGTGRSAYDAFVHEFGHAKDYTLRVSRHLDGILSDAYQQLPQAARAATGLDQWISRLSGYSFHDGVLNPAEAVPEAFADIEINGRRPGTPQQAIHDALNLPADVTFAERPKSHAERQFLQWWRTRDDTGGPYQSLEQYAAMHELQPAQAHRWLDAEGLAPDGARAAAVPDPLAHNDIDSWTRDLRRYLALNHAQMDALLAAPGGTWAGIERAQTHPTTAQLRTLIRRVPGGPDIYEQLAKAFAPELLRGGVAAYPEGHVAIGDYLQHLRGVRGLSQRAVAAQIEGLPQSKVSAHEAGRSVPPREVVAEYLRVYERDDVTYAELAERFPDLAVPEVRAPEFLAAESLLEYSEQVRRRNRLTAADTARLLGVDRTTLEALAARNSRPTELTMLTSYDNRLHRFGSWNDLAEAWGYAYRMAPGGETWPTPERFGDASGWLQASRLYRRLSPADVQRLMGKPDDLISHVESGAKNPMVHLREIGEALGVPRAILDAAQDHFAPPAAESFGDYVARYSRHRNPPAELVMLKHFDEFRTDPAQWNTLAERWNYFYRMDPGGEAPPHPDRYDSPADWVHATRLHRRMTQEELADLMGRTGSGISVVESGTNAATPEFLREFGAALDIAPELVDVALSRMPLPDSSRPELQMLRRYDQLPHDPAWWNDLADTWGYAYRMDPAGETEPHPRQYDTIQDWVQANRLYKRMTQDELAGLMNITQTPIALVEGGRTATIRFLRAHRDALDIAPETFRHALEHYGVVSYQHNRPEDRLFRALIDTRLGSPEEHAVRNEIFALHDWVPPAIARRWRDIPEPMADLTQRCVEATLTAIVNHAPGGPPFAAHAIASCKATMAAAYYEVKFPALDNRARRLVASYIGYRNRRQRTTGVFPDDDETAIALGVTEEQFAEVHRVLGAPGGGQGGPHLRHAPPQASGSTDFTTGVDFHDAVRSAVSDLPDPAAAEDLILLHLADDMPLDEAAAILHLDPAHAADIVTATIPRLRATYTDLR